MPTRRQDPGEAPAQLTSLLNRMRHGDRKAGDQAIELVYRELYGIAAGHMRKESPGHLLQTTALVHEAYLRLLGSSALEIQNRGHFFAIASQQMRRILVDCARAAGALRRGGDAARVDLDRVSFGRGRQDIDILLLDESLSELGRIDTRAAKVVKLRYFGGYTDKQVVEALGVSLATVRRDWEFARSWLFSRMQSSRATRALQSHRL
jgi:RNA polymerase sigma factor (TIGR02999 family)